MCNENCLKVNNFFNRFSSPLFVEFPARFDDYFKKCETDARTCYRRAQNNGFTVRKVDVVNPKEMFEIWNSTDTRQNRKINLNYELIDFSCQRISESSWPVPDYSAFSCPLHNLEMFICEKDGKTLAYLELLNSDGISIVHSTLGHFDYLKYGIMKFMFLEVIKIKFDTMRKLVYGNSDSKNQSSFSFKKDLLIIQA